MTTGERIKARRKELGITADNLAETIGVARSTIFRYENGSIEKITLNALTPIARALRTTVSYLMGWEDEIAPTTISSEREIEAMKAFDSLSEARQTEALNYLRYLVESEGKKY